jgi:predicted PurR-regulated permease PerM
MAAESVPRTRKTLLGSEPVLLIAVAIAALYFGREIFIPIAMALTLSFLLTPLVVRLERVRLRRGLSVLLVVAAATALLTVVGWVVATQLIGVINDLPNYRDNIQEKIAALHVPASGPIGHTFLSLKELDDSLSGADKGQTPPPEIEVPSFRRMSRRDLEKEVQRLESTASTENKSSPQPVVVVSPPESDSTYIRSLLLPVLQPAGTLAIIVVFTIYMLIKREDLRNRILLLAGMGRLNVMTQALDDAADRISRYLLMNVLVNAGYGLVFGAGLFLLHVPNATLWGVLIGILRMVPYFGMLAAGSATIIFTLAVFPGWWHPLFVILLFVALEAIVSNALEPWLYGSHTGVSSLALLSMALVWTLIWGWAGLVLSTPLTVCLIVMGRHLPQFRFLQIILGEDVELAPQAAFYERLLAMDQSEAHAIADRYLEDRSLVELYDGVLLPALILAEQDRHKGNLDEARGSYLNQSVTELVAELTDYKNAWPEPLKGGVARAQAERGCPIVCVAASDAADELSAIMLGQLLERSGRTTMVLSSSSATDEIMQRLGEESNTIVCISALPPFAFAHARSLCQQIRQHLPQNRVMVALWGATGTRETIRERFGNTRPNVVVATLEQALAYLLDCELPDKPEELPVIAEEAATA